MNRLGLWIAFVAMAVTAAGNEGPDSEVNPAAEQATGRMLYVTSGRCVGLNKQAVAQEARDKAWQNLYLELGNLAEECSGVKPGRRRLIAEHAWLLSQPGVDQQVNIEVDEKSYGPVAECSIQLTLPEAVLAEWTARLSEHYRRGLKAFGFGVAATLGGIFAALGMLLFLDRLTGGYRRGMLVMLISVVFVAMTALGWGLLVVYFDVGQSIVAVLESAASGG